MYLTMDNNTVVLINMKIENMREQHTNIVGEYSCCVNRDKPASPKEKQEYGIVTVSMGRNCRTYLKALVLTRSLKAVKR